MRMVFFLEVENEVMSLKDIPEPGIDLVLNSGGGKLTKLSSCHDPNEVALLATESTVNPLPVKGLCMYK